MIIVNYGGGTNSTALLIEAHRRGLRPAIERAGQPLPGKSSCFFCPSMKKHEIDWLADHHPDLLARALRIEDQALAKNAETGRVTSIAGLGRNFSWRGYLEKRDADLAAREIVEPECGCYDGGSGEG